MGGTIDIAIAIGERTINGGSCEADLARQVRTVALRKSEGGV
jgi:hypothetical protein